MSTCSFEEGRKGTAEDTGMRVLDNIEQRRGVGAGLIGQFLLCAKECQSWEEPAGASVGLSSGGAAAASSASPDSGDSGVATVASSSSGLLLLLGLAPPSAEVLLLLLLWPS